MKRGHLNVNNQENGYCTCKGSPSVTTGFEDDFGYWLVCTQCGKRRDGEHHYYNHYDGADHEMFWTMDGGIDTDGSDDD